MDNAVLMYLKVEWAYQVSQEYGVQEGIGVQMGVYLFYLQRIPLSIYQIKERGRLRSGIGLWGDQGVRSPPPRTPKGPSGFTGAGSLSDGEYSNLQELQAQALTKATAGTTAEVVKPGTVSLMTMPEGKDWS